MGNYFSSLLNLKKPDLPPSTQINNNPNNKTDKIESKNKLEKLIPYSYIPEETEDEDINNNKKGTLKCIRVIKSHQKWCNCLIKLKSGSLCSCSGDRTINIYSNDTNFNIYSRLIFIRWHNQILENTYK